MSQKERIYNLLRAAGKDGVTNVQLNKVGFRFSARIKELRDDGYKIVRQHVKGSIWRYYLES